MRFITSVILITSFIFLNIGTGLSQMDTWKIHLQFTTNFGFPENNIGFRLIGEYRSQEDFELALGYSFMYHFRNFGPNTNHSEHALMGSAHYVWGDFIESHEDDLSYIKFLDSRTRENSFGYTWQRYFNGVGTTQNVGTIHMRFNKTVSQFSNDVFANTNGKDRYRTGGFAFGFYDKKSLYLAKLLIWTGDSHCKEMKKVRETDYPARWGYRDITDCNYGRFSHGLLSMGVVHDIGYGQTLGGQVGIDSEHIRHYIQNRVFHDLYFIPRFINKTKNLHLPMKTENGENYLFEEDQTIRPDRFVWQFSLNPSSLY